MQAAVESRDRDVRHLHDALDARSVRPPRSHWSRARPASASATTRGTRHGRLRTPVERRRIAEVPSTTSAPPTSATASGRRTSARTGTPFAVSTRTTRPPRSPAAPTTSTVIARVSPAPDPRCTAGETPPCVSRDTDPHAVTVRRSAGGRSRSRRSEHRTACRHARLAGPPRRGRPRSSRPSKHGGSRSIRAERRSPPPAVAP